MAFSSFIPDVVQITVGPIERDYEVDYGFRRTIEIRNAYGTDHTVVITSSERSSLEMVLPPG